MGEPLDVASLLRDLGQLIPRASRFQRDVRDDPQGALAVDPFQRHRWVTTRTTFEATTSLGDPASPYLAAWVFALLLARVNRDAEIAASAAEHAPIVPVLFPVAAEVSLRDAIARLLRERAPERRAVLSSHIEAAADEASARSLELWARRGETARKLGQKTPDGPLALTEDAAGIAQAALSATDDHAKELLAGARTWHDAIALGVAQDAEAPWPRALTSSLFFELFRGEARWWEVPDMTVGALPSILGTSSFTRAFAQVGAAWASAAASRELPRALAHHPMGLERWTMGALFASLLTMPVFLTRTLGFSRAETERTRRTLARILLVATRLRAARVLLRGAAFAGDRRALGDDSEEHLGRALTTAFPRSLALVLPRLAPDDTARLLGSLRAASLGRWLRDRFDEDWFRNPEAVLHLRHELARAPTLHVPSEEAKAGVAAWAEDVERAGSGRPA